MTQLALASRVGVSRAYIAKIEGGSAHGVPLELLFALAEALGRPFRAEFVRDRLEDTADAGHLAVQELVLRLGRAAGFEGRFELTTRPADPSRSSDVVLLDKDRRRMVLVECWNAFGDVGAAARSTDRKLAEAQEPATAVAADGGAFTVGACWVVRDTARNRELTIRYPNLFASRFPGSSAAWVRALTERASLPTAPGLVWCDVNATRLFAP